MRGDLALTARLLLRRTGAAGSVAALGGATSVAATMLPWWVVTSTITTLGRSGDRVAASLNGVPDVWMGWLAAALGAAAVLLGGAVAIDRPLPHARELLGLIAGVLVLIGVSNLVTAPGIPGIAVDAGERTATLGAFDPILPVGVDMTLGVHSGPGPWLLVVSGVVIGIAAVAAHER